MEAEASYNSGSCWELDLHSAVTHLLICLRSTFVAGAALAGEMACAWAAGFLASACTARALLIRVS